MEELNQLELFVSVSKIGSFSAVARQRHLQPSSVSRQISALEDELGVRLFNRTTRHLGLTEAGELYLEFASRIVSETIEAREAVAQLGNEPSGLLKMAAPSGLAPYCITPHLPEFLARYPKIDLQIALSDSNIDFVSEGYDLCIRMGKPKDSNLVVRRIATSRSVVCASPCYLEQAGIPEHPSELATHQCLSFRTQSGLTTWRFSSPEGPINVKVGGRLKVDDGTALHQAAVGGLGIIMLPRWRIGPSLKKGQLKIILGDFEQVPSSSPINALYPHRRFLAPKVKAMVDFLVERLAKDG